MARRRVDDEAEPRRRRRGRTPWQKLAILVLAAACLAVVLRLGANTLKPVILCWKLRGEICQLDARAKALEAEKKALREKRGYLSSPAGTEAEARKLGYVRPGEVSIIIEDQEKPKSH